VNGHSKIKWLIFAVAAVVIIGAGVGIWLALRPRGVPNVVGMPAEKAKAALTKAGFNPVTVKDTLDAEEKDTVVVNQVPEAKSKLPVDTMKGKTPATIVVARQSTHVPRIVGEQLPIAMQMLTDSGLRVGDHPPKLTNDRSLDAKIALANPPPETPAVRGSNVNVEIWAYTDEPIIIGICQRHPEICRARPEWGTVIEGQRKATARTTMDRVQ
jgi:beta-lactam-binding protein with PASTA domain